MLFDSPDGANTALLLTGALLGGQSVVVRKTAQGPEPTGSIRLRQSISRQAAIVDGSGADNKEPPEVAVEDAGPSISAASEAEKKEETEETEDWSQLSEQEKMRRTLFSYRIFDFQPVDKSVILNRAKSVKGTSLSAVNIMVVGDFGHGKSSLISTMQVAISSASLATNPLAPVGDNKHQAFTRAKHSYNLNPNASICLIDTKGLEGRGTFQKDDEIPALLRGRIADNVEVMPNSSSPSWITGVKKLFGAKEAGIAADGLVQASITTRPHACIIAVSAADRSHRAELCQVADICRSHGLRPLIAVTHIDYAGSDVFAQQQAYEAKRDSVVGSTVQSLTPSSNDCFPVRSYCSWGQEALVVEERNLGADALVLRLLEESLRRGESFLLENEYPLVSDSKLGHVLKALNPFHRKRSS